MHDPDFKLQPSQRYLILFLLALCVSSGCLYFLPSFTAQIIVLFLVVAYGLQVLWCAVLLRGPESIIRLKRESDGAWLIFTPKRCYTAALCGKSTVTNQVSILRFRIAKRRLPMSCVIFPDALAKDRYRALLVILRMY